MSTGSRGAGAGAEKTGCAGGGADVEGDSVGAAWGVVVGGEEGE
jgi:hypothetical protein